MKKVDTSKSEDTDDYSDYFNEVCRTNITGVNVPLTGRLIKIGPSFLVFEKRDGRLLQIRRNSIVSIEALQETV